MRLISRVLVAPWAALRRVVTFPQRQVRWKILAPFVGLSMALAAVGTYLVTDLVTSSLDERFTNQLAESARVASDSLVRREREHLELLRTVSFTAGVPEATRAGQSDSLAALVLPHVANAAAERIDLLGPDGAVLYQAQLADPASLTYVPGSEAGSDPALWESSRRALDGEVDSRGDKFAEIVSDGDEQWFVTAGPIRLGDEVVGVVVVGSRVSSVVAAAKLEALSDVTFYSRDWAPVGSSLVVTGELGEALGSADAGDRAPGDREELTLNDRGYQFLYGELALRGEPVGFYSVALPTGFISTANNTTRLEMSIFFALVILAVTFVGWRIARRFTDPLSRLVTTAGNVTSGDLTARTSIRRSDEIGRLAESFDRMTAALRTQLLGSVEALVSAIDARDSYTRGHSVRVGHLSAELGAELGFDEPERHHLQVGGYLHDIGKIGIRDDVLLKPGALSDEERAIIQQHPGIGHEILSPVGLPQQVLAAVVFHHERLNGSGYPVGLKGKEISIYPRVVMVADVYDALVTERPYRPAMPVDQVIAVLKKEAMSSLLDPDIVVACENLAPRWEERWRNDEAMSGFSLDDAVIDPAVFTRLRA